ncbi:hypothetical protein K505DRAFT_330680 [Melanomma pulvis-pyrius CBS 109.77]|uniref:Uncharacterized protein n=1 Tax=Melanomma pulvis-pyrius CBS 109.77 TaxID=1314802 RepID=A0A6A6WPD2_9PLEO|nr:hypothetical protein K505DRAFT_330680 [Melanomma pulvis-pyrius CBS 109.77]
MSSEDRRALALALSDESTIKQLSSSGKAARDKRQDNQALKEAKEKAEAKQKAEAEKAQGQTG